jgi:hypothetical protein
MIWNALRKPVAAAIVIGFLLMYVRSKHWICSIWRCNGGKFFLFLFGFVFLFFFFGIVVFLFFFLGIVLFFFF